MKIILSWSGGKDSTMSLYTLRQASEHEVAALLTTVTQDYDRISMHGVRRAFLERQAAALGLPVRPVWITANAPNGEYETKMEATLKEFQAQGVEAAAFGDIFLEDLRRYREANMAKIGMGALFPIWKRDTTELITTFIELGFKAVVTCVDTQALDASFAGRMIDADFVRDLPEGIDPCGENGEFHSFVFDGPLFRSAVRFTVGEKVLRDERFCFCDLLPE